VYIAFSEGIINVLIEISHVLIFSTSIQSY
jgi:hypothetical protein